VVPEYSFVSWWVRRDWLDNAENREALANFIVGLIRGKEWAHAPENRERMLEIWMQETQSPRNVAEKMYEYYMVQRPAIVDSSDIRPGPIQSVAKILQELEDLPALPPESQWIDRAYVERARQAVRR
jgi:ABC-type nitrate/sulfonate/bicarbonate transport system substrate-binding protein